MGAPMSSLLGLYLLDCFSSSVSILADGHGGLAWPNLGWNGRREAGRQFCAVPCVVWWWYMQVVCENGRVVGGSVQSEGQGEGRGQTRSEQGRMDQGPELEKDPMVRAATLPTQEGVSGPISMVSFLDPAVSKTEGGNSSRQ